MRAPVDPTPQPIGTKGRLRNDFIGLSALSENDSLSAGIVIRGNVMRRGMFGILLLGLLTAPVHAQQRGPAPPTPEELEKKREAEAVDRQYKSTLQRMKQDTTTVRSDPWANMRGPSEGKR